MTSSADRRSEMKAVVLDSLSVLLEQGEWESWYDAAKRLGLSEEVLGAVLVEVRDELHRRAVRLTRVIQ